MFQMPMSSPMMTTILGFGAGPWAFAGLAISIVVANSRLAAILPWVRANMDLSVIRVFLCLTVLSRLASVPPRPTNSLCNFGKHEGNDRRRSSQCGGLRDLPNAVSTHKALYSTERCPKFQNTKFMHASVYACLESAGLIHHAVPTMRASARDAAVIASHSGRIRRTGNRAFSNHIRCKHRTSKNPRHRDMIPARVRTTWSECRSQLKTSSRTYFPPSYACAIFQYDRRTGSTAMI